MCGVIVLISIGFAVWDYLSERDIRSKARKIVIASAAFDKQGRLLVRPDGHLPMHVIESLADLKVGSSYDVAPGMVCALTSNRL